jgi:threonyl-tRNA synthetase
MFFVDTDEGRWALKPMNCPGHNLIYRSGVRSYRDLPLRLTEPGQVHRNEMSGVVSGLTRVRSFAIDDAHIYCTPDQLCDEIVGVMDFVLKTYRDFAFPEYEVELSTRPLTGSIGSDEMWENATNALKEALDRQGGEYRINPGDGAFYGPKIDFHLKDSLNRRWQCGTIQVDFAMPERFDLEYVGADGDRHRPVMVHRAVFGSLERFIAVLLEHHAGKLPVWLSPVQVVVLNITDAQAEAAGSVHAELVSAGLRSRLDVRNEKIGKKIREATLEKIPYMLVLGDREVEDGTVSVRERSEGDLGSFSVADFVARVTQEISERR